MKSYLNMEKINQRLKTLGSGKYLKLTEGDTKLRILPRVDGSGLFALELTQHYGFKDNEGRDRAYPCLAAMKDEECPICKFVEALEASGEGEEVVNRIRAKTVFLSVVVDRTDNNIKIWSFNPKMFRAIANYLKDPDYGEEFLDPDHGYDLTVTRTGQMLKTRYECRVSPRQKPIGVKDWEKKVFPLKREVEMQSYNALVKAVEANFEDYLEEIGLVFKKKKGKPDEQEDEDGGEAVEETPQKKNKKAHRHRMNEGEEEVEEEEIDEEEEVEEDEEEEIVDEPPRSKKHLKKGKHK